MSHHTRRRFRSRIAPLGLALALIVVAVPFAAPAAAKGPVFYTNSCAPVARNVPPPVQPRADCDTRSAALTRQKTDGSGGTDAAVVAGGTALLALATVGGLLLANRRRGAPATRPATQS